MQMELSYISVSVFSNVRLFFVLALRVTRVETYRLEALQAPGIYWEAYTWRHPEKHHRFIAVMYARCNRIRWHAISHFLDWKMRHVIVQTSDMEEPFQRNFTFFSALTKSLVNLKFENRQICSFSVVGKRFMKNCISCYTPGAFIIVHEQLFHIKFNVHLRCAWRQSLKIMGRNIG